MSRGAYKIDCVQKFKEWIRNYVYNWFTQGVSFNVTLNNAALSYRKSAITGTSRYRCRTQDSNKRDTLYNEIMAYENSKCYENWAYTLFLFNAKYIWHFVNSSLTSIWAWFLSALFWILQLYINNHPNIAGGSLHLLSFLSYFFQQPKLSPAVSYKQPANKTMPDQ